MADQIKNETVNTAAEETQAAETKVEQQNAAPAPADQPGAPAQPEKEKKEHPKWDAFKTKAKKVGKWVGLGAAVVGGLFVANKLGQAKGQAEGFDAACEGLAKASPDPVPVLPGPTDGCGVDTIADVDFGDVAVSDLESVDTTLAE